MNRHIRRMASVTKYPRSSVGPLSYKCSWPVLTLSFTGITQAPLRLDSQVKYGALARGDGVAYFRMPTGVGYKEKIWVRFLPHQI